jgi:hypothetical protein
MMHWLCWFYGKLPFRPERPGGVAFERVGFTVTFERVGFSVTIEGPIA